MHTDAFTGEEFTGEAVILSTTEGHLIVSRATLEAAGGKAAPAADADQLGALTARVEELEEQLRTLAADKAEAPAAKTSTTKAAAK